MIIVIHFHRVTANLLPFVMSLMAMSIRSLESFASSRTEKLDVIEEKSKIREQNTIDWDLNKGILTKVNGKATARQR